MPKRWTCWFAILGVVSLLAGCGSDGVGSTAATVRERIDRCQDDLEACDDAPAECEASAMRCMNQVNGNGIDSGDIAEECDALYDLCATKTEDLAFCEHLRRACFDCVHRFDEDDDDDSDSDTDDDEDTDDDAYDDDEDTDDDAYDDDEDTDDDAYDDDEDTDDDAYDDDEDTDDDVYDDER